MPRDQLPAPMLKSLLRFYCRWVFLAFRHSFDYASIVATIISLVVAVGTFVAQKVGVKVKLLEQINEMGGWGYALAAAGVLVIARLLLAPYWIYQEEHAKAAALEIQIAKVEEKSPRITCLTTESTGKPEVTYGTENNLIVRVTIRLLLLNAGDANACNYKIAIYSCWFKEPSKVDWWMEEFFATWVPGQQIEFPFAQTMTALDIGGGRKGLTNMDEIVFVVEVEANSHTPDGPRYKEELWLRWTLGQPIRPPNPAMTAAVRKHVEEFKKAS